MLGRERRVSHGYGGKYDTEGLVPSLMRERPSSGASQGFLGIKGSSF